MKIMMTTDLHLTNEPRDAYRWDLFPWLKIQVKKKQVDYLLILGDITDAKDCHTSALVNKIVDGLVSIATHVPILILKGNHDYIDAANPFLKFLSHIENIYFISAIEALDIGGKNMLLLPHTRTPKKDWSDINFKQYDYIFMHETINGSLASNGMKMEGFKLSYFKGFEGKIYSGDIHVPQTMGKGLLEYVGCPYHVRFNDKFTPRVIYLNNNRQKDLFFPCLKKHTLTVRDPSEIIEMYEDGVVSKDDQVKVRLKLNKSEYAEWNLYRAEIRSICEDLGVDLCGVELKHRRKVIIDDNKSSRADVRRSAETDEDALKRYSEVEGLSDVVTEVGIDLLHDQEDD